MGVKIVAQQRVVAGGITRGVGAQPAFGSGNFAVLFDLSVLRGDELRAQRHDLGMTGADEDRRDGAVKMRALALGVLNAGTVRAMDVFGLGRKIPGGVQGDESGVADGPHGLQQSFLLEGLVQIIEQTVEVMRFDRVEDLADVIVSGDALDLKERAGVVASVGLFHSSLETQERGVLGEKDREGRQGDVGHDKEEIVASARVRQSGGDRAYTLDKVIETAASFHAPTNARKQAEVPVTIV